MIPTYHGVKVSESRRWNRRRKRRRKKEDQSRPRPRTATIVRINPSSQQHHQRTDKMSDSPTDESRRPSKSKKSRKKKKKKDREKAKERSQDDEFLEREVNGSDAKVEEDDFSNRPCPYRRNYRCKQCDFLTLHPRQFLGHLRDFHHHKLTIHECPKCEYASRHQQKLKRHISLTHNRGKDTRGPPKNPRKSKLLFPDEVTFPAPGPSGTGRDGPSAKKVKVGGMRSTGDRVRKRVRKAEKVQALNPTDAAAEAAEALLAVAARAYEQCESKEKEAQAEWHSCSLCTFRSRSKVTLARHERMVHLRKKFFRCAKCAYVTHIRSRYTKHMRYHSLPYIKCDFCDFTTPYKWNLDRHLRNHDPTAGEFSCVACGFATHSKQSLTVHVANHHLSAQQFADRMMDKPNQRRRAHQGTSGQDGEMTAERDDGPAVEEEDAVEVGSSEENAALDCTLKDEEELAHDHEEDEYKTDPFEKLDEQCGQEGNQEEVLFVKDGRICRQPMTQTFVSPPPPRPPRPSTPATPQRCVLCSDVFESRRRLLSHLKTVHRVPTSTLLRSFANVLSLDANHEGNEAIQVSPEANHSFRGPEEGLQTTRSHRVVRPPKMYIPEGEDSRTLGVSNGGFHGEDGKKMFRCDRCPYSAKWVSEIVRHRRIHTQEKPFACPHCEFRSRWKGDMTRHVQKYHAVTETDGLGPRTAKGAHGNEAEGIETLMAQSMMVASEDELVILEDGRPIAMPADDAVAQGPNSKRTPTPPNIRLLGNLREEGYGDEEEEEEEEDDVDEDDEDSEIPLDLSRRSPAKDTDLESQKSGTKLKRRRTSNEAERKDDLAAVALRMVDDGEDDLDNLDRLLSMPPAKRQNSTDPPQLNHYSVGGNTQRIRTRYRCPHCAFSARTASRFHVHMVGHLNEKPFMCSECGYRSNWEWDVTKHIKLKSAKGESHTDAALVPVNDGGKRNYEKYDKFLVYEVIDSDARGSSEAASVEEDREDEVDEDDDEAEDPVTSVTGGKRRRTSWKCKYCSFKHTLKRAIVRHAVVHSENKRYWCGLCGQASNWHHCVLRHCRSRHTTDGPIYEHVQSAADSAAAAVPAESEFSRSGDPAEMRVYGLDGTTADKLHRCNICPYRTRKMFDLKMHYYLHQPRTGAIFKCSYCPFYVSTKRSLMPHMRLHSEDGAEEAKEAEDNAQEEEDAEEEFEAEDVEEEEDDNAAESSIPLVWASRGGAFQKMFKCRYCPHVNKKKWTIVEHEKLHRKQKMMGKFACNKCNYKCNNQGVLNAHLKVHRNVVQVHAYVGEEETEATVAAANTADQPDAEAFGRLPRLTMAVAPKPMNGGKTYHRCPQCPARFSKLRVWEVHQTFHGAALPYKCDKCSYAARHRPHLHKHEIVHSDGYQVKFMAGRMPKRTLAMMPGYDEGYAMKSVNPVKPAFPKRHKCHKCPAKFHKPANLVSHLKLHGAKGRFRCPHCEYTVQNIGNLVRHTKLHDMPADEPPEPEFVPRRFLNPAQPTKKPGKMKCPKCPAAFAKRSRLKVHFSLHGSNQRYRCDECDYSVHCMANLYKHEEVHRQQQRSNEFQLPQLEQQPLTYPEMEFEPEMEEPQNYEAQGSPESVTAVEQLPDVASVPTAPSTPSTLSVNIIIEPEKQQRELLSRLKEDTVVFDEPRAHDRSLDRDRKSVFRCGWCPYTNRCKDTVQSHVRRHGNGQDSQCPHCDYTSALPSYLNEHIKLHFRPTEYHEHVVGYFGCDDYQIWAEDSDGAMLMVFSSKDAADSEDEDGRGGSRRTPERMEVEEGSFDEDSGNDETVETLDAMEEGKDSQGEEDTREVEGNFVSAGEVCSKEKTSVDSLPVGEVNGHVEVVEEAHLTRAICSVEVIDSAPLTGGGCRIKVVDRTTLTSSASVQVLSGGHLSAGIHVKEIANGVPLAETTDRVRAASSAPLTESSSHVEFTSRTHLTLTNSHVQVVNSGPLTVANNSQQGASNAPLTETSHRVQVASSTPLPLTNSCVQVASSAPLTVATDCALASDSAPLNFARNRAQVASSTPLIVADHVHVADCAPLTVISNCWQSASSAPSIVASNRGQVADSTPLTVTECAPLTFTSDREQIANSAPLTVTSNLWQSASSAPSTITSTCVQVAGSTSLTLTRDHAQFASSTPLIVTDLVQVADCAPLTLTSNRWQGGGSAPLTVTSTHAQVANSTPLTMTSSHVQVANSAPLTGKTDSVLFSDSAPLALTSDRAQVASSAPLTLTNYPVQVANSAPLSVTPDCTPLTFKSDHTQFDASTPLTLIRSLVQDANSTPLSVTSSYGQVTASTPLTLTTDNVQVASISPLTFSSECAQLANGAPLTETSENAQVANGTSLTATRSSVQFSNSASLTAAIDCVRVNSAPLKERTDVGSLPLTAARNYVQVVYGANLTDQVGDGVPLTIATYSPQRPDGVPLISAGYSEIDAEGSQLQFTDLPLNSSYLAKIGDRVPLIKSSHYNQSGDNLLYMKENGGNVYRNERLEVDEDFDKEDGEIGEDSSEKSEGCVLKPVEDEEALGPPEDEETENNVETTWNGEISANVFESAYEKERDELLVSTGTLERSIEEGEIVDDDENTLNEDVAHELIHDDDQPPKMDPGQNETFPTADGGRTEDVASARSQEDEAYLTVEEAVAKLFEEDEKELREENFLEDVAVEVEVDQDGRESEEDSYAEAIVLLKESEVEARERDTR